MCSFISNRTLFTWRDLTRALWNINQCLFRTSVSYFFLFFCLSMCGVHVYGFVCACICTSSFFCYGESIIGVCACRCSNASTLCCVLCDETSAGRSSSRPVALLLRETKEQLRPVLALCQVGGEAVSGAESPPPPPLPTTLFDWLSHTPLGINWHATICFVLWCVRFKVIWLHSNNGNCVSAEKTHKRKPTGHSAE